MRLNGGLLSHSDSEWLAANKKALAEFNIELEDSLKELRKKLKKDCKKVDSC